MTKILFARIGWMKRYRGPQADDPKPIGGGRYNKKDLGNEAFNFLPANGEVLGYFQPRLMPGRPSSIALERIQPGITGAALDGVIVVFVATHPRLGGQRIVGWFRDATVYRHDQPSDSDERNQFSFFLKATVGNAFLVPEPGREFRIPGGEGAFGQANVCYALDEDGLPKAARWIGDAIDHVNSYERENIAQQPESETYDFLCNVSGEELYVEVKGTQDNGDSVSLTPKEVEHALKHKNSALFIVHSVKVKGKRKPFISGGREILLHPWDISEGTLRPRGFVFSRRKVQEL